MKIPIKLYENEKVLKEVKPSKKFFWSLFLKLNLILTIPFIICWIFLFNSIFSNFLLEFPFVRKILINKLNILFIFSLIFLILLNFLYSYSSYKTEKYIITNKRIIILKSMFLFFPNITEIPHEKIKKIEIRFEKLFKVGNLCLYYLNSKEEKILLLGIEEPEKLKDFIMKIKGV